MIHLHDNELRFTFPTVAAELRALLAAYVDARLPAVLAENRAAALETLFARNGPWWEHRADTQFRTRAAREAQALPASVLADAFRRLVLQVGGVLAGDEEAWPEDEEASTPDESWRDDLAEEVRPAWLGVSFQRTLRLPDDGRVYPLPAGLGSFPLRRADDFADRLPAAWTERGGVLMPMYQAEALWIHFSFGGYPGAVQIGAGGVNAVSAEPWRTGLHREPAQNYVIVPEQPWLDGFAVEPGVVRQFVATPLGEGGTVEEQLTGRAEFGGLQLRVWPLRAAVHFAENVEPELPRTLAEVLVRLIQEPPERWPHRCCYRLDSMGMGMGMGGRMRQKIYPDERLLTDWDQAAVLGCCVHVVNSAAWRQITGAPPPSSPITAQAYADEGIPWFTLYDEGAGALPGAEAFGALKSVHALAAQIGTGPLPGEGPIEATDVIPLDQAPRQPRARRMVRPWDDASQA